MAEGKDGLVAAQSKLDGNTYGSSKPGVQMASAGPADQIVKYLDEAAVLLKQASDEELRQIWDSRALDRLLDSIFDPATKRAEETVGDFLLARKLRATYAACIRTAVTRGYSFSVTKEGNTTFLSPTDLQWFEDHVMFTEGPSPFEGALGRYRPGEISYAIMARSVTKGAPIGPNELEFIGLDEFQSRLAELRKRPKEELWRPFAELKDLLDRSVTDEATYQEWIERHPWVLGLKWDELLRHKRLNDENIPDFTIRRIGKEFHDIVEMKPPSMPIFRADGEFSTEFLRAWDQAERYLDFARRDADYLRRRGIPVDNPRCYLIAGKDVTGLKLDTLRRKERSNPAMEVLTYDDVSIFVEATIRFVESRSRPST